MKTQPLFNDHLWRYAFLLLITFTFVDCNPLKKASGLISENKVQTLPDRAKVDKLLNKALKRKKLTFGAEFQLGRLAARDNPKTMNLLGISHRFCELEEEVRRLPIKQIRKLARYKSSPGDIRNSRENLQLSIVNQMSRKGTIPELLLLEKTSDCWSEGAVDSLRRIVVNKNISPKQLVFDTKIDAQWEGTPLVLPTEKQMLTEKGRSCVSLLRENTWGISYTDFTSIMTQYPNVVMKANYSKFWKIKENVWKIFEIHQPYCEMDQFKINHYDNPIIYDCWYDQTHEILCSSELKPLLAFHTNNPHVVLDVSICNQILCLDYFNKGNNDLSDEERQHIEDVRLMLDLQRQLLYCELQFTPEELIVKIIYLVEKYTHHKVVFDLAVSTLDYFSNLHQFDLSKEALTVFQPLFPDKSVCVTDYYYQVDKQRWFDNYKRELYLIKEEGNLPELVSEWNTLENDEYALVSWGETDEVFFVRRNSITGIAQVMTSVKDKDSWTEPKAINQLSIDDDVVLLSMNATGRLLLLKSGGELFRAYRADIGWDWMKPQRMAAPKNFAANAWLSPNDSLLVMEYYAVPPKADAYPQIDLAVAKLRSNGTYGRARPLGGKINQALSDEGNPIMALDGRMLFYTSDNKRGVGDKDMYSVSLNNPHDWASASAPKNLGIPVNTVLDDNGLTCFSEYTGLAYYHQFNQCTKNIDIWQIRLRPGIFPPNAMRLAGIVLDENGQPVDKGFVEFTANYDLSVHSLDISLKGTYIYTVADSTEVVRIYSEVPGYYSELDSIHHLTNVKKGEIIRDTFHVTSFDYIRKNFKLVNSTFRTGTADFDQPNKTYPELTRLAKIATRMGAELELQGHTDNKGTKDENLTLSISRAETVKRFLVDKCGFDADKIKVSGYGATRPNCSNDTEEGQRCNRRIDVAFKMPTLE